MAGSIIEELLSAEKIPEFAKIACTFPSGTLKDIPGEVKKQMRNPQLAQKLLPGKRIAITAGSRKIAHIKEILKAIVEEVKAAGAIPYIVASMGSHGGADALGQRHILEEYGITQEEMGARVVTDMTVCYLSETPNGLPVYLDSFSMSCDGIIVVNRIKPHTDFHGRVESGLCKMIAIGLGKQKGAALCHKRGFPCMAENIYEMAGTAIEHAPILFGMGILEDANHEIYALEGIPSGDILKEEPRLLEMARDLMPQIPFDNLDPLIVQEIGKNISGAGMDPNITGRSPRLGISRPHAERIVVLDISKESWGSGTGIGNADAITRRAFEKFRFDITYPNGLTSCDSESIKIPPVMEGDKLAVQFALRIAMRSQTEESRKIVWIKNTSYLQEMWISQGLMEEAAGRKEVTQITPLCRPVFDEDGNFLKMVSKKGGEYGLW